MILPHNQILDGTGRPALSQPVRVWRHQQQQQNQAVGELLRNAKTGRYYQNPTTGKLKQATAESDCDDCCTPSPCTNCASSTGILQLTLAGISQVSWTWTGIGSSPVSFSGDFSELNNGWSLEFCYQNQNQCMYGGCYSSPFVITFDSPSSGANCGVNQTHRAVIVCNLSFRVLLTFLMSPCRLSFDIFVQITPYFYPQGMGNPSVCSANSYGCTGSQGVPGQFYNYPLFVADSVVPDTEFCGYCSGTGTGTGTIQPSISFDNTLSNSTLDFDATTTPWLTGDGYGCCAFAGAQPVGYGGTGTLEFIPQTGTGTGTGTGSSSPTNPWTCSECNQPLCECVTGTGTGTGTGTSPSCNCGSSTPCDDTETTVSVNLDGLKACDPDFVSLIIPLKRIAGCPNAEWYGIGYFGNVNVTIKYVGGCYEMTVIHTPPGHVYQRFFGTATSLTGSYTYCSGDCTTPPVVTSGCSLENCSNQCGDCTQLGTVFTFTAATTGQMRLIFNDQVAGFWNNNGSYTVTFTAGDTGTYTCDARAENGSPGPMVTAGTVYSGTATGLCCGAPSPPFACCCTADGAASCPGCSVVGDLVCPSLTAYSLVGQICDAPGTYCDGICDDSLTTLTVDTSAFNDGICVSTSTDTANQTKNCSSGFPHVSWAGAVSTIQLNNTCYTLTITCSGGGQWIGNCCTPTGTYCETSNSTGKSVDTVSVG